MSKTEEALIRIIEFAIVDLTSPNMHHEGYISSNWIHQIVENMKRDLGNIGDIEDG